MPRVPTYDSPQVNDAPLPGFRQSSVASPALFGAAAEQTQRLGQGLTSAGGVASNIATQMQEKENADMIFRAETSLKDNYLKFEQDAYTRKGVNANGVTADAEKFFTDQSQQHSELLQNDAQRKLFNVSLTKLRHSSMGKFAKYEAQQQDVALDSSTQSTIVGTINQAAADASNGTIVPSGKSSEAGADVTLDENGNKVVGAPNVTVGNDPVAGYTRDIKNRVSVLAALRGMAKPEQEQVEAKYISDMHQQVIQNMVDKNYDGAKQYYTDHKDEVLGTQRDAVEKTLKIGGLRGTAQSFADQATGGGLSESQALAQARAKYSGEEEAAVVDEVKSRYGEVTQLREKGQKDMADQAWHTYAQTGNTSAIPSATIAAMDGRDVETLRKHAADKAAGVDVKTNPGVYYDLRQLAAAEPNTFKSIDMRRYVNSLSPSDFQEFVKLQTNPEKHADAATLTQQLSDTHEIMKWGAGNKDKMGAFDKAATDAIQVEQDRLGKPLDYKQRQGIIDKMLIQGKVPGSGWFSDSKTFYEVSGKSGAGTFEPKPDQESKQQIVDRYKAKNGREPSPDEVNQIYKKWKGF